MHRLHPDYRRAWIRFMVGIKSRIFPGHGSSALERWLNESDQVGYRLTNSSMNCGSEAMVPVAEPTSIEPWVWLENQSMISISRYLGRDMPDLNSFHIGEPAFRRSSSTPLMNAVDFVKRKNIKRVFLLPWLRHGGADRLAIEYIRVIAERYEDQVLVILTEPGRSPRVNELPVGCELLFWADLERSLPMERSAKDLAWFLCEIGATSIHVINSHVGWEMLKVAGPKVRVFMDIWVSLFWYGPSPRERLRGYATEYLPCVVDVVDGVITDNATFPLLLQKDYGIDPEKLHVIYNPVAIDSDAWTVDNDRISENNGNILWASRFSLEKRLDILFEIARRCSQYKFMIFGSQDGPSEIIDQQLKMLAGLRNVSIGGEFQDFMELPFRECDLFLYTSSSDGLPNILIEAMAVEIPVIAPAIGGVGELVDEETGWLVDRFDDVDEYQVAISDAMRNPVLRRIRAEAGRRRISERHTVRSFVESLERLPDYL